VRAAIEEQAEHFDMLGLQLGFAYEAGALVPDGSAPPRLANPVRELAPNGRPGARLPHAWIDGGGRRSTLDLVRSDGFTLFAGPRGAGWIEAATAIDAPPLTALRIGADVPDTGGGWAALLGIEADGALLVRPDQHVAWRSARGVADPAAALRGALQRIVGRAPGER
jgi:2,4-dichlorophenol 6-monooxygenase